MVIKRGSLEHPPANEPWLPGWWFFAKPSAQMMEWVRQWSSPYFPKICKQNETYSIWKNGYIYIYGTNGKNMRKIYGTFPTEWKVIQNSMVPVTTNQLWVVQFDPDMITESVPGKPKSTDSSSDSTNVDIQWFCLRENLNRKPWFLPSTIGKIIYKCRF